MKHLYLKKGEKLIPFLETAAKSIWALTMLYLKLAKRVKSPSLLYLDDFEDYLGAELFRRLLRYIREKYNNPQVISTKTDSKSKYTVSQLALWFLNHVRSLNAQEDEEDLTVSKLQKLLYCAQGLYLNRFDCPLFEEELIKTAQGVEIRSIKEEYASYGKKPIHYEDTFSEDIDTNTELLLKEVYENYGKYSSWGLAEKLKQFSHAWQETSIGQPISLTLLAWDFDE